MFPSEIICEVQNEDRYQIKEIIYSTFYIEIMGLLIFDEETKKYNLYIIPYENYPSASNIFKNGKPQSLEFAKKIFPDYNLTEENYGFIYTSL